MKTDRRSLLKYAALAPFVSALTPIARAADEISNAKADYTLRIATGLVELSPKHIVSTTLYNDQFPGPLLRFKEGQRVIVDIYNGTDTPELVHWHGQMIPSDVDGAAEEGTPFVPAQGMRRVTFVPTPSGFRFYHTHIVPGADLNRGMYAGLAGPVYIESKDNPGAYDREVFLVMKEFGPTFSHGGDMSVQALAGSPLPELKQMGKAADQEAKEKTKGFEVDYELFAINGRMLGHGDPIRVKQGERVLFHVLNASATETRSLALPGHIFRIVALDGNPVATQAEVPVLWLGTAERVSALVTMDHPGVWVMEISPITTAATGWGLLWNTRARRARRNGSKRSRSTGTTRDLAKRPLSQRYPRRPLKSRSASAMRRSMASTNGPLTAKPSRCRT